LYQPTKEWGEIEQGCGTIGITLEEFVMNRISGIVAIAGLVASASAQNYILGLEGGPDEIDTSNGSVTFTIDVVGDAEAGLGTHMLWGSFGLAISGAEVEDIVWTAASWSVFNLESGYGGDGEFSFVEFGQWENQGVEPDVDSSLGSLIGRFEITLAQNVSASGMLNMSLLPTTTFGLSTIDIDTFESYYSTPETLRLEGYSTNIVPTPASGLVLMGSGLWLMRRRR
jgi:hypothetical protein